MSIVINMVIAHAPRWTRRSRPNFRRIGGSRTTTGGANRKRSRLHQRARGSYRRVKRKTEGKAGGYNQWTRMKKVSGRRVSSSTMDKRLVRASREYKILGHRNLKSFDDYGAVPINSSGPSADVKRCPIHCYCLNAQNSTDPVEVARVLEFNDASNSWSWNSMQGLYYTGAPVLSTPQVRKSTSNMLNQGRQYHEYSHVKLNVWGAKAKAIRYQIDIVRPLSDEVNPYHWGVNTPMGTAACEAWEEMVKQYTFNPIAKFDHYIKKNFKTVKSISFIIDPTSTNESDADPHVKTIDWFIRVNKLTNFDKVTQTSQYTLADAAELKSAADFTANSAQYVSALPRDRETLLLLIRASDYSSPQVFTNNLHGSYDIDFATKFTQLG